MEARDRARPTVNTEQMMNMLTMLRFVLVMLVT